MSLRGFLGAVLAVAVVATVVVGSATHGGAPSDEAVSGSPPAEAAGGEPGLRGERPDSERDARGVAEEPVKMPAPAGSATAEEFIRRASTVESSDWAAWQFGQPNSVDPDVVKILEYELMGGHLAKPPYVLALVLGPGDLPWLRGVAASLEREFAETNRAAPGEVKELNHERRLEVLGELAVLASARLAESPRPQAMFEDARPLQTLDADDSHRRWLEAMISSTEHSMLWTFPDVMPRTWRASLSARDLSLLRRLQRDVFRSQASHDDANAWREQVCGLAEELRNHLESRAPR